MEELAPKAVVVVLLLLVTFKLLVVVADMALKVRAAVCFQQVVQMAELPEHHNREQ
jgi:hypothetical protein